MACAFRCYVYVRTHVSGKHYVSSPRFLYDLAGAMPIDTILRMEGTQKSFMYADIASVLRLIRLRAVSEITEPLHLFVQRAAIFFPPIEPISKLLMMIMTIVGITHFMACLLYFTGHPYFDIETQCDPSQGLEICGWVKLQGWEDGDGGVESNVWAKYVTALYYASTQITTVGFGDISAKTTQERAFSVFSQMFGGFVFGYVLGNISTLLASENVALATHSSYMETLHHFMKHEGVPPPLHRRVMQYMEYRYPKRTIYDENRLYSELPPSLRGEIAFHRFGSVIEQLDVFSDLSYQTAALLCSRIDLNSFVEGDTITNAGAVADRMFILKQGLVNIYDATLGKSMKRMNSEDRESERQRQEKKNSHEIDVGDAVLIEVVGPGHAVAELAAVMPFVQPYTCKCMAYCLVCTLQRRHIIEIAGVMDELADALETMVVDHERKVTELCSVSSITSYESVLTEIKSLKSKVNPDVDAVLGGGISGGVAYGASAMDQYQNVDVVSQIYKLTDDQARLAANVEQGFAAINAKLEEMSGASSK